MPGQLTGQPQIERATQRSFVIMVKPNPQKLRWTKKQRSRLERRGADTFILFSLIALLLIALRGVNWSAKDSWQGYQSQRWPQTQGVVVSSSLRITRSKSKEMYSPQIVYRYRVAGKEWENDVYGFPARRTTSRREARNQLAAYPPGASTKVFYDPSNPQSSCLTPGFSLAFALWFLPLSLALMGLSIFGLFDHLRTLTRSTAK